ncbi:hypothetical protein [Azohydromonas sp.]|uniref:hypothetical protein n=1 Tax=Azohydromonas sp. TaxID=1872666 RepID=UPI002D1FB64B|nr:hypothetical protein [Azohydromonas sp.]
MGEVAAEVDEAHDRASTGLAEPVAGTRCVGRNAVAQLAHFAHELRREARSRAEVLGREPARADAGPGGRTERAPPGVDAAAKDLIDPGTRTALGRHEATQGTRQQQRLECARQFAQVDLYGQPDQRRGVEPAPGNPLEALPRPVRASSARARTGRRRVEVVQRQREATVGGQVAQRRDVPPRRGDVVQTQTPGDPGQPAAAGLAPVEHIEQRPERIAGSFAGELDVRGAARGLDRRCTTRRNGVADPGVEVRVHPWTETPSDAEREIRHTRVKNPDKPS